MDRRTILNMGCRTSLLLVLLLSAALCLAHGGRAPQSSQSRTDTKDSQDKKAQQQPENAEFSEDIAYQAISKLRDGLVGHSPRVMLSAFDREKMEGYLTFQEQIQAFFSQYETFRVHFGIAQTTVEGARGVVLVDFELEEIPRDGSAPSLRKSSQIRFELEPSKKSWKIVDFRPRAFFS